MDDVDDDERAAHAQSMGKAVGAGFKEAAKGAANELGENTTDSWWNWIFGDDSGPASSA